MSGVEESLRESVARLEQALAAERGRREVAEATLTGLRVLAEASSLAATDAALLAGLAPLLRYQEGVVLAPRGDGAYAAAAASCAALAGLVWRPGPLLARVLAGASVAIYDVRRAPELAGLAAAGVRSALCMPVVTTRRAALLVGVHAEAAFFSPRHVALARGFAPTATRVLESLATKEHLHGLEIAAERATQLERANRTLERRVEERTRALARALDELRAAQAHAVQSEKMAALGSLVAGVAHEISTPVGVSVTAASSLEEATAEFAAARAEGSATSGQLARYLEHARLSGRLIMANLERAAELIQSFQQVAVDRSGEARRRFMLRRYVEQVLLSLQPELRRSQQRVVLGGGCEEVELLSYPGALAQVVTNLVMNSLQHAGASGPLRLALREDGERVELDYADDGRGIAEDHLSQIFDPFFTTGRDRGRSGLGLHIVYNLVTRRLGGTIGCESAPGRGVRFRVSIPRTSPAEP
ncbi:MAG: HAMP domain-containing histidine kinase [Myxococcales bacterium]|nr:HAMP domain-containing histidine kinase [Myxococcales bacterium]